MPKKPLQGGQKFRPIFSLRMSHSALFPVTIYFVGKVLMLVIEVLKLGESKILLLTQRESQISLLIFCDFWNFCIFMLLAITLNLLALNT